MTSKWWGVAVLASAHYSRCAAGFEQWPKLPFGTRAMIVQDPTSRNAFVPRSWPATVFGPSSKVPGGMIVFQGGKLKEVVNLQTTNLDAEELVYVQAQLKNEDEPFAPTQPPTCSNWDATRDDEGTQNEGTGEFVELPEAPHQKSFQQCQGSDLRS